MRATSCSAPSMATAWTRRAVHRTNGIPSGVALITVASSGDNAIVVSPGANHRLTADDVRCPRLAEAAVVLLQLEIPIDAVVAAAEHATGLVVCNPAPARHLPPELLAATDVLVPNESELGHLTGLSSTEDLETVVAAARTLDVPRIVVTLGQRGALVVEEGRRMHVAAPTVTPVDTTAAGDSFCAALADELVAGTDLVDAARWAVRVGAATTLRAGAQTSLPTRAEVATVEHSGWSRFT
ncbi:MAG: PfkB family carbohydrate kinase [Acidimicrobiia bacterium]|nr:PfkB family carbohydrate kinase [Acidimicrobiia bacterium]